MMSIANQSRHVFRRTSLSSLKFATDQLAFSTSSVASASSDDVHSTTVLCVRKNDEVVLVADGQVTMGGTVVKPNVRKTRKIGERAIGGFAGATADAFTLFEQLETKLEEHPGNEETATIQSKKSFYSFTT